MRSVMENGMEKEETGMVFVQTTYKKKQLSAQKRADLGRKWWEDLI